MPKFEPGHWVRQEGVKDAKYHLVQDTKDGQPVTHNGKALADHGGGYHQVPSLLDPADGCQRCSQKALASAPAEA